MHGIIRMVSTFKTSRIDHLYQDPHISGVPLFLHFGDLSDSTSLIKLLYRIQSEGIYHLATQSHVRVSFDIPEYTGDVTGLSTIRILEAVPAAAEVREYILRDETVNHASAREAC